MRKILPVVLLFLAFLQSPISKAQDLLTSKDLSTIRVDNLTESDISKIKAQLQINNLTIDQAEPIALAKGMTPTEFAKLRNRMASEIPAVTSDKSAEQF